MRMQSTRAKPMSISRAARNGNASLRQVGGRHELHQLARARALDVDLRVAGGHVGDERVRVAEVALHPGLDVAMRGVGRDDPEALVVELGDGEVGLELAALVEPLRVRDHARRRRRRCSREIQLSSSPGVAALDEELRHERHVHEDHALARGAGARPPSTGTSSGGPTTAARICGVAPGGAYQSAPSQPLTSRKYAPRAASRSWNGDCFAPRAVCIERVG